MKQACLTIGYGLVSKKVSVPLYMHIHTYRSEPLLLIITIYVDLLLHFKTQLKFLVF